MNIKLLLRCSIFFLFVGLAFNSCHHGNSNIGESDSDDILKIKEPIFVFVGTYTENQVNATEKSKGIYVYKLDPKSGELSFVCASPETVNPSYLVIHPSKKWLYAVNEVGEGDKKGYISAFSIDLKNKQLPFINSVPSQGTFPCYINVDHSGKYAMAANYGNGTVALFSIKADGSLSESISMHQHMRKMTDGPEVQPHAHMIIQGPGEQFVYSSDLGTDMVWVYKLDTIHGKLEPALLHIPTQNGSGPRHIEFHPKKPWAYVINELNGTIEAFETGQKFANWNRFQTISTLAANDSGPASCADIHIAPSGKYLYASNRGEKNNLAIYAINQESGELEFIGHQAAGGKTPRNFVIDPTGTFLLVANQNTNNIVTFRIDKATGKLVETGKSVTIPSPVCLKFF